MDGRIMKNTIRKPKLTVARSSSWAPLAAWEDRLGKMAVAIATPKIPNGN